MSSSSSCSLAINITDQSLVVLLLEKWKNKTIVLSVARLKVFDFFAKWSTNVFFHEWQKNIVTYVHIRTCIFWHCSKLVNKSLLFTFSKPFFTPVFLYLPYEYWVWVLLPLIYCGTFGCPNNCPNTIRWFWPITSPCLYELDRCQFKPVCLVLIGEFPTGATAFSFIRSWRRAKMTCYSSCSHYRTI